MTKHGANTAEFKSLFNMQVHIQLHHHFNHTGLALHGQCTTFITLI